MAIPIFTNIFWIKCSFTERIEQGKIAKLNLPKAIKDYLEYKDSVGADGADGADGANGADVADGADGANGGDGGDGADGTDGADVADNWIESQDPKN